MSGLSLFAVFALACLAVLETPAGATAADPARPVRELAVEGFRVVVDMSEQVIGVNIPEDRGFGQGRQSEAPVSASLQGLNDPSFVSASVLAQKAKQFDDGLYAAVELAAEQGAGSFAGKTALLRSVAEKLAAHPPAQPGNALDVIFGACRLGYVKVQEPPPVRASTEAAVAAFLADALRSKPIGFYTWSSPLSAIFQQDRMLQTELKGRGGIEALAKILHDDSKARASYEGALALAGRLTNPFVGPSLKELIAGLDKGQPVTVEKGVSFWPPSRAHETELIKKLYGNRPIPEGFNLANELIRQIQAGTVSLRPTADSGWYDYQTWALEPLVLPGKAPESAHLDLSDTYQKQLLELFKGLIALTRETHIKQLEIPMAAAAAPFRGKPKVVITLTPGLSAEPLATFYLRRALAYGFVQKVLEDTFGAEALHSMHRLTAEGPVTGDLASELDQMTALFLGASAAVSQQLGIRPLERPELLAQRDAAADRAKFDGWMKAKSKDIDLSRDVRMMVPVFYDLQRKQTKVWVFLVWTQRPVTLSFATPPKVEVFQGEKSVAAEDAPEIRFQADHHDLSYPVTAEVYVTRILNRDQFRAHCDRYKTVSEILKNLK